MNRDQHIAEAEALLERAYNAEGMTHAAALVSRAQVHALLAQVAPVAASPKPPAATCPEIAVSGERCVKAPGHDGPHRMEPQS